MELIAITENGELTKPTSSMPVVVAEVVGATTQLYGSVGYEPPWIGYLAFEDDICVGACGFKSPPENNRVEIAYFTFPEHESRGVATQMASELILLAREKLPAVTVAARRLPFAGETVSDVIVALLKTEPAPLVGINQNIPAELERIVSKTLVKEREERYQTAKDLLVDLRRLKKQIEIQAEIERAGSPNKTNATHPTSSDRSPTPAFSCGARSASDLMEKDYLRKMLSRGQLQGFVWRGIKWASAF